MYFYDPTNGKSPPQFEELEKFSEGEAFAIGETKRVL